MNPGVNPGNPRVAPGGGEQEFHRDQGSIRDVAINDLQTDFLAGQFGYYFLVNNNSSPTQVGSAGDITGFITGEVIEAFPPVR